MPLVSASIDIQTSLPFLTAHSSRAMYCRYSLGIPVSPPPISISITSLLAAGDFSPCKRFQRSSRQTRRRRVFGCAAVLDEDAHPLFARKNGAEEPPEPPRPRIDGDAPRPLLKLGRVTLLLLLLRSCLPPVDDDGDRPIVVLEAEDGPVAESPEPGIMSADAA